LPAPPECYCADRDYPVNWDLYRAEAWDLPGIRQDYLDLGRQGHALLHRADPPVEICQIAGCNLRTLTDLWRSQENSAGPEPNYLPVYHQAGHDAGDDTVPLWSACMPNIETRYVEEHHQSLCANSHVIEAVLEWIHGGVPDLPGEPPQPQRISQRLRMTPIAQQAAQLRDRLLNGEFSREDIQRLFFPD
jgi:hypothetical protein